MQPFRPVEKAPLVICDMLVGGEWVTNGGGLRVSNQFGFGVLDVEALVTRARWWVSVPEQQLDAVVPSQINR